METIAWKKLDHQGVLKLLPERKRDAHKGDFGKILLLCGSRGYTGAAALAAMGALRCGAGLVYLGVPACIYAVEAVKLTEPVVFPLPDDGTGYAGAAVREVEGLLANMDAVLIGSGMGQGAGAQKMLECVLGSFSGSVVVDADGINLLPRHMDLLRGRTSHTILTPHAGEFARLGGDLHLGRERAACAMARELGCIVLLKGQNTLITDGSAGYSNPTGNPGMAVGGSGDVLSGMIASLLGQGLAPLEAAACAAWLHGAAGDLCAREMGEYGMLPSDMVTVLPRLLK
ncbi:MAG TPA: NAD(P)H-hydrate dehydratase [Candidatus Faecousia intestinigallinarum]|nr:NAD(P)H-hydrate dehydratase [Candidatus Faecousia intestinigallinarum]